MGVDQIGFELVDQLAHARGGQAHLRDESCALGRRRAVEAQTVGVFFGLRAEALLGCGEVEGLPAQRRLLAQDGRRAEGIAAVQWQRMIEDVQDAHVAQAVGNCSACADLSAWCRKASNIIMVHSGAL